MSLKVRQRSRVPGSLQIRRRREQQELLVSYLPRDKRRIAQRPRADGYVDSVLDQVDVSIGEPGIDRQNGVLARESRQKR
jgi:hypothetical protein